MSCVFNLITAIVAIVFKNEIARAAASVVAMEPL
jgi:hypothetical protein